MFKKGDRIIAKIDMLPYPIQVMLGCKGINKGHIDTIRGFTLEGKGILLEGIKNPPLPVLCFEIGYPSYGFEKLVSDEELIEYKNTISEPEINPITIPTPEPEFV